MKLNKWLSKKVLAVAHAGDIDACASFVGFRELAKKLGAKKIEFCVSGSINKDAQRILKLFRLKVKSPDEIKLSSFQKMVLLDTQPNVLPAYDWPKDMFIIDHHIPTKKVLACKNKEVDPKAVSTTEIIARLFKKYKIAPSKKTSEALVLGVFADTGGFKFAKTKTFKLVYDLLTSHKIEFRNLLRKVSSEIELQERLAWLKSAQRIKLIRHKDKVIVVSHVGAYESSACQKLLGLGADVSLVISRKGKESRIVGRAREGYNLAKIFINVSEILGGCGGGHPGAAGLTVPAKKEKEALSRVIKALKK